MFRLQCVLWLACAIAQAQGPLRLVLTTPSATLDQSGAAVQLHAYQTFLRGTAFKADVTNNVFWSSSDSSIASINSAGLVTPGATIGTVVISARTTSGPAARASITLSVTAPTLTSITVLPAGASVHAGLSQQFSAIGNYSNGSSQDITNQVTWDSIPSNVATIVSSGAGAGNATGAGIGTASISAKDPATNVTGSTMLTVDAAILQSIDVQPKGDNIAAGLYVQFSATGSFSDGSSSDITSTVTWASDNLAAVTISSGGVATAVAAGSSTISASSGSISGSAPLDVTPAQLSSIAVTPLNGAVVVGQTQQFTATGSYTDSSTQNITAAVNWSSTNASAASIDASGLATAKITGGTTITAISGSITGNTSLTVNAGSTATAFITSVNPSVSGQTITFTATVTAVAPAAGTPSGTVTFFDGATNLGSAALDASGQATLSLASLAGGSHNLTVSYSGDGNFNPSTSANLTQTVSKGSSSTSLISSVNPSVSGQSITLTATVTAVAPAAGTPTATVTFFDGVTNLGSAALDASGQATLSLASLSVGTHDLTARYNGDGSFNASTSAALAQSVAKGSSSISLVSSVNPSVAGQTITLTATVTAVAPAT